jgi:hypothetical protein
MTLLSVAVLYLGASSFVFSLWLLRAKKFNRYEPARTELLLGGGAQRPFSSRVLVPWLARGISACVPEPAERALVEGLFRRFPGARRFVGFFATTPGFFFEISVVLSLCYLSLIGFLFALRRLFLVLYRGPPWLGFLTPAVALFGLPLLFRDGAAMPYDFPTLFFFALGFAWLLEGGQGRLLVLMAVGTLNRETFLLFPLVAVVALWNSRSHAELGRLLAALLGVGLVARGTAVLFSSPGGEPTGVGDYVRNHLGSNLVDAWHSLALYQYQMLAALVVWGGLLCWSWKEKHVFLRRSTSVLAPILIAAYLVAGVWGELRVFYEIYPLFFLLVWDSLLRMVGHLPRREEDPSGGGEYLLWTVGWGLGGLCLATVWTVVGLFLAGS